MNGAVQNATTDLAATRAQLTRAVSLLEASLNATADGLLVIARDGAVLARNERFLELWRIPDELASSDDDSALLAFVLEQLEDPEEFLRGVYDLYDKPDAESFGVIRFKDGRVFERYSRPQRIGAEILGRVWSFRDVSEREHLLQRAEFLARAGRLLASLDVERAVEGALRIAVPFLGEACAVDLLVDEDCAPSAPRRLVAIGRPAIPPLDPAVARALRSKETRLDDSGTPKILAAPLCVHNVVKGLLRFGGARRYTKRDVDVVEALAGSISLSLENAWLYRSARQALASRDEFLSIAAHELRGPVTSIHLAAQSLRRARTSPEQSDKLLEVIEREDVRLSRFVDELVELTRIRSGHVTLSLERVDLAEVVRDVAARCAPEIARSGSSVIVDAQSSFGSWDRARLEDVVANLLSNASKFGRGMPITLAVRECGERSVLSVTDQGVGVPAEAQATLFEPFERAVSARHYGGLGLGLYLVRTIVERLGGEVRLESNPGTGTRVTVDLPRTRGE